MMAVPKKAQKPTWQRFRDVMLDIMLSCVLLGFLASLWLLFVAEEDVFVHFIKVVTALGLSWYLIHIRPDDDLLRHRVERVLRRFRR